jgi:hypothetical protein
MDDSQPEESLQFLNFSESQPSGIGDAGTSPIPVQQPQWKDQSEGVGLVGTLSNYIGRSTHPVAAVFHLAFKLGAIFTYVFGGLFSSQFILLFAICVLLLAFDFWTVKVYRCWDI